MKRQMVRSGLNHFLWVRWKVKPVLSGEPGAGPVWVIWSGFPSGSELLLSGAKRRRKQKVAVDSFLEEALVGDHSCSKQESLKRCLGFWILDENFVLAVACDLGTCTTCCHVEPGAHWPSSHGISVSKGSHIWLYKSMTGICAQWFPASLAYRLCLLPFPFSLPARLTTPYFSWTPISNSYLKS